MHFSGLKKGEGDSLCPRPEQVWRNYLSLKNKIYFLKFAVLEYANILILAQQPSELQDNKILLF